MSPHEKTGVVVIRCLALVMLVYAVPIVLYGLFRISAGATTASDGVTSSADALTGWAVYAIGGILLFFLARPLARVATRDLE
jgi:hypothetical protein